MKLHEIKQLNDRVKDAIGWLEGMDINVNGGPLVKDVSKLLEYDASADEADLISSVRVFELAAKNSEDGGKWSGNVINPDKPLLDWYLKKDQPQRLVSFSTHRVDSLRDAPNSRELELHHCYVKSLVGIEQLTNLKRFFWTYSGNDAPFGVLRLLKLPNLIEIKTVYHVDPNDLRDGEEGQYALEIVNKHLKDKNIADCMDDLIAAGLKEYAKQ